MKPYHHHAIPSFKWEPQLLDFLHRHQCHQVETKSGSFNQYKNYIGRSEKVAEKVEGQREQTKLGARFHFLPLHLNFLRPLKTADLCQQIFMQIAYICFAWLC